MGPRSPPKKGHVPNFLSATVCCSQTVTHVSNCWALVVLFVIFSVLFLVPCSRLSWLTISLWAHVIDFILYCVVTWMVDFSLHTLSQIISKDWSFQNCLKVKVLWQHVVGHVYLLFTFWNRRVSALASWILPLAWHVLLGLSLELPGRGFIEYWSDTYLHTYIHCVSKKLCKIVFVRTSSNFHQFW